MGTKAGAEKARQRRAEMALQRDVEQARAASVGAQPEQLSKLMPATDAPLISADVPSDADAPGVRVARQMLTAGAPMAADVVNRIVAGKIKAPAAVRANTAIRALEMAGVPDPKPHAGAGLEGDKLRALFGAFQRISELRSRAATAETVAPIAPAGAVESAP